MAHILRVALSSLSNPERAVELKRLFGNDVRVTLLAGQSDPTIIAEQAGLLKVDAVVFDAVPLGAIARLHRQHPDLALYRAVFGQKEAINRYGFPTMERTFAAYEPVSEFGSDPEVIDLGDDYD